jgi:hypothetical protein
VLCISPNLRKLPEIEDTVLCCHEQQSPSLIVVNEPYRSLYFRVERDEALAFVVVLSDFEETKLGSFDVAVQMF